MLGRSTRLAGLMRAGDYLLWVEALDEAQRRATGLLLVTGDEKEDWWLRHRGHFLGPRPELVAEYEQRLPDGRFHMMRPRDLLERAIALKVAINSSSLADVDRVETLLAPASWTADAFRELILRLEAGNHVQAAVVIRACEAGGTVSRDEVFRLGEYGADRMLRGFTRPPTRIMNDLVREGLLQSGAQQPLSPVYSGVIASAFRVPPEFPALWSDSEWGGDDDMDDRRSESKPN